MASHQKLLYRLRRCDCDCGSMPEDPCAPCDSGAYQLQCRSRSGIATLCGFGEFTSPTIPPRRFRRMQFTGAYEFDGYFAPPGCEFSSALIGTLNRVYSGACTVNDDCQTVDTSFMTQTAPPSFGGDFSGPTGCSLNLVLDNVYSRLITTQTSQFIEVLIEGCAGPKNTVIKNSSARRDLFEEDTEEAAMERANPAWSAWGTGTCCTSKTMRGAGQFTFGFSEAEYRIRVAGAPGTLINIELTFTRSDGAPYTEIRQFVASDVAFPESPDVGWTTFRVTAGAGQSTCLASHRIYRP